MNRILITGVAAAAVLMSSTAMAACPDDVNALRVDLQNDQAFQQHYTAGRIDRSAYFRLFEAAQTFGNNGLEARCQEVLAGIKELSEKVKADAAAAETPKAALPGGPRTDPNTATDRPDRRAEQLRAGKPITDVSLSWDHIVGASVRNLEDKNLGDLADVMIDQGKITSVVIGRGGFLGMGVSHYLVAADEVKVTVIGDVGSAPRSHIAVIDMTEDQIKAMPLVKKEGGTWVAVDGDSAVTPPRVAPSAPPSRDTAPVEKAPPRQQ